MRLKKYTVDKIKMVINAYKTFLNTLNNMIYENLCNQILKSILKTFVNKSTTHFIKKNTKNQTFFFYLKSN